MNKKLLIPFFTAGFPELDSTTKVLEVLSQEKADYIEIGLPHSDALADGPTIQDSSHMALTNGMNIEVLFEQVSSFTSGAKEAGCPNLILFSYFNPLFTYGLEKVCEKWKAAGGSSILVPDLPIEESEELSDCCEKHGLTPIFLVAPTSTEERIKKIAEMSKEFVYLVSVTGVTGVRKANEDGSTSKLKETIQKIKKYNPQVPVAIGFGIGDGKAAKNAIENGADGVIVGSAIVKLLKKNDFTSVRSLVQEISEEI